MRSSCETGTDENESRELACASRWRGPPMKATAAAPRAPWSTWRRERDEIVVRSGLSVGLQPMSSSSSIWSSGITGMGALSSPDATTRRQRRDGAGSGDRRAPEEEVAPEGRALQDK